jgi:tetratricopeptide (TPR) repeat protein
MRPSLFVPLVFMAISYGGAALAQSGNDLDKSRSAFKRGAVALDEGRPKEALVLFREAQRLHPSYATWFNIGLCERALGHPLAAVTAFRSFLTEGGSRVAADKKREVDRLLAESRAKVATLHIDSSPTQARVSIDGVTAIDGSAEVDPGEHTIDVNADGFVADHRSVLVESGKAISIPITLLPINTAPVRTARLDGWFWGVAGGAAVSVVAGVVMGSVALSDYNAYRDPATSDQDAASRKSRGEALKVGADVAFGVGISAAAVAAVLALTRH